MTVINVTLRSVAERSIGSVDAGTVGDLLDAAQDHGYSRCSLVHKGRRLPQDPDVPLSDAGVSPGDLVTVVGARRAAPTPRPRPRPPRASHQPVSLWGPAGPPSLGPLRGNGPAAPPGSQEVGGRTVIAKRLNGCEERQLRVVRQGFRKEVVEDVQRVFPGIPEDAAREALRLADGDPWKAGRLVAAGRLPPPVQVNVFLDRDLRESQFAAARTLLRGDAGKLAGLMAELEKSHPQLYEAVLASRGSSEQFVFALSSDRPRCDVPPALVAPNGQHIAIDASPAELQNALASLLEPLVTEISNKEKQRAERLTWLKKATAPRSNEDKDEPSEPETPQSPQN